MTTKKFGVDIGGVLIGRENDNTDTSFFGRNYLLTTEVPDAFDSLRKLTDSGFEIFLVSKCGESTEKRTLEWLDHHNFYERTGVQRDRVHFCRERAQKAGISDALGLTHFIDDRLEVLSYLENVKQLFLINENPKEVRKHARFLPKVKRVATWREVTESLLSAHSIVSS